jgi:two-component system NtrC family response regulator
MLKGGSPTQAQATRTLLIVDDERSLHLNIGEWARETGYHVLDAYSGREGLQLAREHAVDVVLLDLRLGDLDGLQVLRKLREEEPSLPVVMISAHGSIPEVLEATQKLGAFHWIEKRGALDLEHLGVMLRNAVEQARLRQEVQRLRAEQEAAQPILGDSPELRAVLQKLEKAARSSTATVLLRGETGVGKDLLARFLHQRSGRAAGPFIEVNCSALPENLLESELFGYEKGAFTDAKRAKKGMFEVASGGTLFLDEIGEMTLPLQAKLLRALETKRFRHLGGTVDLTVDTRVVAATNRDLTQAVREKRFREDLYFRLNVIPIEVPPLRQRVPDLGVLIHHYVERFCRELGRPAARVHPEAMRRLLAYAWPGNVRELRNVIERVLLLESEDEILPEHLPAEIQGDAAVPPRAAFPPGEVRPLAEVERMAIEHALACCQGNKTRAAQLLGISRQTLRTKLKEYALGDDTPEGEEG